MFGNSWQRLWVVLRNVFRGMKLEEPLCAFRTWLRHFLSVIETVQITFPAWLNDVVIIYRSEEYEGESNMNRTLVHDVANGRSALVIRNDYLILRHYTPYNEN